MRARRLVVGMTGATGAIYGLRLLAALRAQGVETHVIVSKWAQQTIAHETGWTASRVRALASEWYQPGDMGAAISSGSFRTDGMVVAPCSVGSLGAIASGAHQHLVHRAADVTLKERRPLVLLVRETPLSAIHLRNMLTLAECGAVVMPPMPAFYNHPRGIDDQVDHLVARVLDQFGLEAPLARRWTGRLGGPPAPKPPASETKGKAKRRSGRNVLPRR